VYRFINPASETQLPFRMLFQPTGRSTFYCACEADSPRSLVAALLADPAYETGDLPRRLQQRIRLADDVRLLLELEGEQWWVGDKENPDTLNVHSDRELLRSLEGAGFISLGFDSERME